MSNQEVKYMPFTNTDELMFHLEVSQMLLDTIKTNIELIEDECLQKSKHNKAENMFVNYVHVTLRLQEFEPLVLLALRGVGF